MWSFITMDNYLHLKVWIRCLILTLFAAVVLSSCSTTKTTIWNSQETVTLAPIDNQKIAKYVVDLLLLNGYSIEETTFFFERGKETGRFGQALESQLQKMGYTLASTDSYAQKVTYVLDELASEAYRVVIRVESDYQMESVYRLSKNDRLVLHSVTVRNGSSIAVSCCNMLVEVNNDVTNDSNDSKAHEIETVNTVNAVDSSISSDDFPGDFPSGSLSNSSSDFPNDSLESASESASNGSSDNFSDSFSGNDDKNNNTNLVAVSEAPTTWAVQVISLSEDKVSALEAISSRIEAMGYQLYIADVGNAKKVRVGPFDSLRAVKPVLDEMRSSGYPDAFLVY